MPFCKHEKLNRAALDVDEAKSVAHDRLTGPDRDFAVEHRPGKTERVELAALAARVDAGRQLGQQRGIVLPAHERRRQLLRIDAGQDRPDARANHRPRERRRVCRRSPDWKQGNDACTGHHADAVVAHVLKKEIAERHVRDAGPPSACDTFPR